MKKPLIFLSIIPLALLSSCGRGEASLADYVTDLTIFSESKASVNIMQLSDLHWSAGTDMDRQKAYLEGMVHQENPDIIVLTGDNVLTGTTRNWETLFEFMDSLTKSDGTPIYWTTIWGNHDRTGFHSPDYPSDLCLEYSSHSYTYGKESEHHGLYQCPDDEVFGRSNWVINLKDQEGVTRFQLYGLDSNTDTYENGRYYYDCIHEDQIEWFEQASIESRGGEGNEPIPSFAFFHIPFHETALAYDAALKGRIAEGSFGGDFHEPQEENNPLRGQIDDRATACCISYHDYGFFDAAKENGVLGIFYGHDHVNDFWAIYEDVLLAYATKSGDQLYYNHDLLGCNMIRVNLAEDGSILFNGRRQDDSSGVGTDFRQVLYFYEGEQA